MQRLKLLIIILTLSFTLILNFASARASQQQPQGLHPLLQLAPANTFVVTSTADAGINSYGAAGTLRWAMNQANGSAGFDLIRFDIAGGGVKTITVKDWLPDLTDNAGVMLDGTQSDDRIEINTANQNIYHYGLALKSHNNVIKGLVINNTPAGSAAIGLSDGASYNLIIGNYLGTNPAGTVAKGAWEGIKIGPGSHDNVIGGTNGVTPGGPCTGDCNLLSGNRAHGLVIDHANNNKVIGNFIGLNVQGTGALPNADDGLLLANSANNIIGGPTPAERNVISGNGNINVEVGETNTPTVNNLFQRNYIGTNSAGNVAIGGPAVGVVLGTNSSQTTMDSNVIAGNGGTGILIFTGSSANRIVGNFIGVGADGNKSIPNKGIGIILSSNRNQVWDNIVANSPSDGIRVKTGTGNTLRRNSVYNSSKLAINIAVDGFTPNDAGDGDNGPNALQNFPTLTSAGIANGTLTVQGNLNSRPNTQYAIDLFQNPVCENTYNRGVAQTRTYLGSVNVTTNGSGDASFAVPIATGLNSGVVIGTATDSAGNTSEVSLCRAISNVIPKPAKPQQASPDNGATTSNPPQLSWNAASGAERYVVIIRQDATNGITVHKNGVGGTSHTAPALAAGHTYYWRLKACNAGGCSKSAWWSFRIP